MILVNQILAITFGFVLLAKEKDGNIGRVFEIYVGSTMADGCFLSLFVTYWFFLENVVDRINIINESLRLKFHLAENFKFELKVTQMLSQTIPTSIFISK